MGGVYDLGPRWVVERAVAIARDGGCAECGSLFDIAVHHIKSLREFDGDYANANRPENLVTLCRPHHIEVHGGVGV